MCAADSFEPNDTRGSAAGVSPGLQTGLQACSGDDDFFALGLLANETIDVDLRFSHAEGDIDLQLLDGSGNVVASGTSGSDDESLSYTVPANGTYAIRAFLYSDTGQTPGNGYDLDVAVTSPQAATCSADGFEPNDTSASLAVINQGGHAGLTLCPGDHDYFGAYMYVGETLSVDASFAHAEGDIDLWILDSGGNVLQSSQSTSDNESVSHSVTVEDAYIIYVELYQDLGSNPGNGYNLNVSF